MGDGPSEVGVPDVVGGVREAGQVAALDLVLALRPRLDPRQPRLDGRLQRLPSMNGVVRSTLLHGFPS